METDIICRTAFGKLQQYFSENWKFPLVVGRKDKNEKS